jgi:hypothetical protein
MKNTALWLALWLGLTGSLQAQVTVEVSLKQEQFLAGESLPVKVRVANDAGQTLIFGDEAWLSYAVEARDGSIVLKSGEVPITHNLSIKPSEWAAMTTDIAPYFDLTKNGRYSVVATVYIKDWQRKVSSPAKYFDVISGNRVWEQEFGLPQAATDHNPPEVRKYILQQLTLENGLHLYARLTDATESRLFKVIPIGPMISFSDPQTRVDQASNLHLLYQTTARTYSYTVINPDGEIKLRQTYVYVDTVPRLKVDETGTAMIVGGKRQLAENDVPASRKSSLTNDIPPPAIH